jgi:hypothetical protein
MMAIFVIQEVEQQARQIPDLAAAAEVILLLEVLELLAWLLSATCIQRVKFCALMPRIQILMHPVWCGRI